MNDYAKNYDAKAEDAYHRQETKTVRENKWKKDLLYSLKRDVLKQLYTLGHYDRIECHNIEGIQHYCFYIGSWSFHVPINQWDGEQLPETEIKSGEAIGEYGGSSKHQPDISLESAILHLCREFEYELSEFVGLCSSTGN
ncbi:hypothetical protein [Halosimplex halobium]|uniref:hypothetical protein n=1 Tax=Halosimplex halobium TaxID=3396618 RepID=UPI003F5579AF